MIDKSGFVVTVPIVVFASSKLFDRVVKLKQPRGRSRPYCILTIIRCPFKNVNVWVWIPRLYSLSLLPHVVSCSGARFGDRACWLPCRSGIWPNMARRDATNDTFYGFRAAALDRSRNVNAPLLSPLRRRNLQLDTCFEFVVAALSLLPER